jgi:formylmethanofuran dehydrogenase subunit E
MSWLTTADPIRDAAEHDTEFEEWLQTRPVCMWCGEPIQDDTALELGNGWICKSCVEYNTRVIPEGRCE